VVASIGDWAFADCTNLLVITLPTSVTSIGTSAFQSCERLVNFEFVNSAPTHNNDLSIGYGVFNDCKSLKFIQLATKINTTGINNTTFYLCSNAGVIKSNQVSGGNDAETNWIPNLPGTGNTRWYFIQNPAS
jgi:hypothetical protein